jgi:hypothetical protein
MVGNPVAMSGEVDRDRRRLRAGQDWLGLSLIDLWIGYVAVGGTCSYEQVARYLAGDTALSAGDVFRLAITLNEEFTDRRQDRPVMVEANPFHSDSLN